MPNYISSVCIYLTPAHRRHGGVACIRTRVWYLTIHQQGKKTYAWGEGFKGLLFIQRKRGIATSCVSPKEIAIK